MFERYRLSTASTRYLKSLSALLAIPFFAMHFTSTPALATKTTQIRLAKKRRPSHILVGARQGIRFQFSRQQKVGDVLWASGKGGGETKGEVTEKPTFGIQIKGTTLLPSQGQPANIRLSGLIFARSPYSLKRTPPSESGWKSGVDVRAAHTGDAIPFEVTIPSEATTTINFGDLHVVNPLDPNGPMGKTYAHPNHMKRVRVHVEADKGIPRVHSIQFGDMIGQIREAPKP